MLKNRREPAFISFSCSFFYIVICSNCSWGEKQGTQLITRFFNGKFAACFALAYMDTTFVNSGAHFKGTLHQIWVPDRNKGTCKTGRRKLLHIFLFFRSSSMIFGYVLQRCEFRARMEKRWYVRGTLPAYFQCSSKYVFSMGLLAWIAG
jgi:hypothetical protein